MHWNTLHDEFSLEGKIDGEDAWVTFRRHPFDNEEPESVLAPKRAIIEEVIGKGREPASLAQRHVQALVGIGEFLLESPQMPLGDLGLIPR